MSLQACADIVARGDPDRFAATMAAPVEARRVLFPIYAFNVEVARAPWVASEPMIGEMRLQWWRDALEEIGAGGNVRRHEVTTPLAGVLDRRGAEMLDQLVQARRWDLYSEPFEDEAHFREYLDRTGGLLMWAAARSLGAPDDAEEPVRRLGGAAALARYFAAVPALEARGRIPLLDGRADAVAALASRALAELPGRREVNRLLAVPARAALLEAWQARACLAGISRAPRRVAEGTTGPSPFAKRLSLLIAAFRG